MQRRVACDWCGRRIRLASFSGDRRTRCGSCGARVANPYRVPKRELGAGETAQKMVPATTPAARPAEMSGRSGAIPDGEGA